MILIFCDVQKGHIEYLSWAFMWFEAILFLKVNLEKSESINVEELARDMGCRVGNLPITYLGLQLGAPFRHS